jgi:hypothetical protein
VQGAFYDTLETRDPAEREAALLAERVEGRTVLCLGIPYIEDQAQTGQTLEATSGRKETKRAAGNGRFWCGIGNNIPNLPEGARRKPGWSR